jgi:glycosyltransferase involved in cell wall biosynthesis
MRVLIVANHNTGRFTPFIIEQVEGLRQLGIEIECFGIHGKGVFGYLSNRKNLKKKIEKFHPDLIHAHYGLSGLLANLQRKVPVVTTYHGSDIHTGGKILFFSKLSIWLSAYNIFVSQKLLEQSGYHGRKQSVIACGINDMVFHPVERNEARKQLHWDIDGKYVLFAGAFDNEVKNCPLAKAATLLVQGVKLMELRGYTREQVCLAMNAANCLLLTSFREGSPQVIKEAMACGTPLVSVDVGDVKEVVQGLEGCYIATYKEKEVAACLQRAISFQGKTNGRQRIIDNGLSNELVAKKVIEIYKMVGHQK